MCRLGHAFQGLSEKWMNSKSACSHPLRESQSIWSLMSISAGRRRKMAQQNAVTMIRACMPTASSAWPLSSRGQRIRVAG